jgi:toxin HigB-1
MIVSFRSKALRRCWEDNDTRGLRADWVRKTQRLLMALDAAESPDQLDSPGFGFHALTANMAGRFALTVSRNWQITFAWSAEGPCDIDLEDYHG